jgi:hypothetical protein
MPKPLRPLLALAALSALAIPAMAHHGWSWTEDGFFQLEGTITEVYFGNPHPHLQVDVEGEDWRVELATPAATTRAGFTEDTAKAGDEVLAIGNRSRDSQERRMKAVRVTVNGATYDVYPTRVPPS